MNFKYIYSQNTFEWIRIRMKRSGSGNLDELPSDGEFRRGGVRATAGGRLGWTTSPQHTR